MANSYPVKLTVDYPDRPLNRLTTFFRIFVAIPILIILALLIGTSGSAAGQPWAFASGVGILFLPTLLMILFRQKYPRWWFDWNINLLRFILRVKVFMLLMRDEYPATDEEQAVHLEIKYPDVKKELNRWLPIVKWIMAIPHYIILACLYVASLVVVIIAWFAIVFTGKFPKDMFDFLQSVIRWSVRVTSYAFILVTDEYPPFSLQ